MLLGVITYAVLTFTWRAADKIQDKIYTKIQEKMFKLFVWKHGRQCVSGTDALFKFVYLKQSDSSSPIRHLIYNKFIQRKMMRWPFYVYRH